MVVGYSTRSYTILSTAMCEYRSRWMIRRDMDDVLRIAGVCGSRLDERGFRSALRKAHCVGHVATTDDNTVVGYLVYHLFKSHVEIVDIGVDPSYRLRGVGRELISKLQDRMVAGTRKKVITTVPESNMGCLLFLKACGFKAVSVLRGEFADDDGYSLEYRP